MPTATSGYLVLLRTPGVARIYAWSAVARLQFGVVPLALLLLLAGQRHSYADAGAATAGYALTAGLLGPPRAGLADRFGHGRVLALLAAANAVALVVVVALATAALPLLVGAAVLAGCLPPPVGPVTRAGWRTVTSAGPALPTAYSLDAVTEEVLFVVGPLVAAVGAARLGGGPTLVLSVGALTGACVGLGLAVPPRTTDDGGAHATPRGRWRSLPFLAGLCPAAGVGVLLGALDLAAVAAAVTTAGEGAAGLPAAVLSCGSVVGGLLYGRRSWPGGPRQHAMACLVLGAAAVALTATLTAELLPMLVLVVVTGVFVAPSIVASYLLAEGTTDESSAATTSWVTSAFNVGIAAGTALSGVLVAGHGPAAGMLAGAGLSIALTTPLW